MLGETLVNRIKELHLESWLTFCNKTRIKTMLLKNMQITTLQFEIPLLTEASV